MTSKEIAAEIELTEADARVLIEAGAERYHLTVREILVRLPLWEIARQLAELNERQSRADVANRQKARGMKR